MKSRLLLCAFLLLVLVLSLLSTQERDQLDVYVEELTRAEGELSPLILESYHIRNVILRYDQETSREEANYRAAYIVLTCRDLEVDPYLICAIIIEESGFDQEAESPKGAKGLMQLMPIIEESYDVDADILEENIIGGVKFIRDLLDQYEGDLVTALAHYNAGSRPRYALRNYRETQNFVEDVMLRYRNLKEKYREDD